MRFVKQCIKRLLMLCQVVLHRDDSPKIVFYHDIGKKYTPMGTERSVFWSHMKLLRYHSTPIPTTYTCHEVAFDDGFRGIWDERERFKAMGIRPTVFIAIRLVGQPGYLTWDEIRTLQNEYGFEFQCHTWSHQTLVGPVNTDLPIPADPNFRTDAWYHHELVESKLALERELGRTVDALCFPVGNFNDDVIKRCAAAGYTSLYASLPGNINDNLSSLRLKLPTSTRLIPRNLVQDLNVFDFGLVLKGGMRAFFNRYVENHYEP